MRVYNFICVKDFSLFESQFQYLSLLEFFPHYDSLFHLCHCQESATCVSVNLHLHCFLEKLKLTHFIGSSSSIPVFEDSFFGLRWWKILLLLHVFQTLNCFMLRTSEVCGYTYRDARKGNSHANLHFDRGKREAAADLHDKNMYGMSSFNVL